MKRYALFAMAVAAIAMLVFGSAWPASAGVVRYEVSGIEYDCLTDPGTVWQHGNVLHMRGVRHTNVDFSSSPELNGTLTTLADADFNLSNGNVTIQGTMHFQPEGIDGAWEGSWNFIANRGLVGARSVAQGIGALRGKTLFLEIYDVEPGPGDPAFCEGIGEYHGTVMFEGYVLDTGTH